VGRVDGLWATGWGTGVTVRHFLPSHADDPDVARQYAKLERLAFSPGALKMAARYNIEIDVRTILPAIRVPNSGAAPSSRRHVDRERQVLGVPDSRRQIRGLCGL
jgi:hypothetical protein